MDWQFKVGLGVAIIFGLLPFWVKTMPNWVTWPGISVGILLILWGLLPNHQKIPYGPAILFIACIAGIAVSAAWYKVAKSVQNEKQISPKVIVTIKDLMTPDKKGFLIMHMAFRNDTPRELGIGNVYMIVGDRENLIKINESDADLYNNYNNMADLFSTTTLNPSGIIRPGFPKMLKKEELWLYDLKEQFDIQKHFKLRGISDYKHIKRIPLGVAIRFIDSKGQDRLAMIYPCSELKVSEQGKVDQTGTKPQSVDILLDESETKSLNSLF